MKKPLLLLVPTLVFILPLALLGQGADPPKKGPLPPAEALKRLQVPDDLALTRC